ncbi:hypothetical protein ACS0TY_020345 [Phlomoides rotata]
MQCELVLDCWDLSGFRNTLESLALHVDSLSDLFLSMLDDLELEAAGRFLMVGWRIWKMRNEVVWENKRSTSYRIVSDASVYHQEWLLVRQPVGLSGTCRIPRRRSVHQSSQAPRNSGTGSNAAATGANAADTGQKVAGTGSGVAGSGPNVAGSGQTVAGTGLGVSGPRNSCFRWHLLGIGVVKFNVDAAIFVESKQIGLGMVARDDSGDFVVGRTTVFPGLFKVLEAEIMGVFEAIVWAWDLGFTDIVIEMGAKNVQEALHKELHTSTVFGSFVQSCVQLRDLFQRCIFSYVPRSANAMSHNFARASRSYSSPHTGSGLLLLWMAFYKIFVLFANN